MTHSPQMDEESLIRYIRLLTEASKRKFTRSYQVEQLSNERRYSYYMIKSNEAGLYPMTVEARGPVWTFTMNQGLNQLTVQFENKRLLDKQGLITFLDVVKGTLSYKYNGKPPYVYQSRKNQLSLEEYIFSGAREIDLASTLRPISEAWVEELNRMKHNQNHFLATLVMAQITAQFINYGTLEAPPEAVE